MAIRVTGVVLDDVDDVDELDVQTVTFGYQGAIYEADLCIREREALQAVFERLLPVARRV